MTDNIFNRIRVETKKTYYIYERYKAEATFALMYHEKELNVEQLSLFVRTSDHLIKLDEHHYFINFAFASQESAFKAAQNLVLYLDNFFHNNTTCIAIDTFNTAKSAQMVINRLEEILRETKKNSYTRIEDESILSEIF